MSQDYVTIERFDNVLHADLAQIRLEEAGIPVFLDNRTLVWADPLLSNAVGNIRVQVPAEYAERAKELIASIRQKIISALATPKPLEDTGCLSCGAAMPDDADTCPACGWSFVGQDEPN